MSASNEKNTHQGDLLSGMGGPRTAREAQQRKEERRSNIMYATIAVLFVLVAIVTLTWKSGIVQRKATAVSINGENYSAAQVQYYYTNVYQSFMNSYSSYASMLGLDTSKDLREQECGMSESGQSWFDYFLDQAITQMTSVRALCDAADADGYAWNDDMQKSLDDNMKTLDSNVETYNSTYGASLTTAGYLKTIFGSNMTKGIYEQELKKGILASSYSQNHIDGLTYTEDELESAYAEDPNSYDRVDYESIRINGKAQSTKDDDGNTVDPTDEETAAALEAAKKLADSFYASYQSGSSLSDLADTDDTATYTDGEAGSYSDTVLMNWLFDSSRKAGDSALLTDEDNSAYYIAVFGNRYRYDYNTVDVRHILIQPEAGTLSEGDDGYEEEQASLMADAKKVADDLLDQWKNGAATEDSFAELANENSSDTGSNTKGGLYTQVYQGEMVSSFNDWCFDPSRQPGDTGVIETTYGYHVMYFVGTDIPYWQVQVTNTLQNNDYTTWYTGLTESYTAEQHSFGVKFVG